MVGGRGAPLLSCCCLSVVRLSFSPLLFFLHLLSLHLWRIGSFIHDLRRSSESNRFSLLSVTTNLILPSLMHLLGGGGTLKWVNSSCSGNRELGPPVAGPPLSLGVLSIRTPSRLHRAAARTPGLLRRVELRELADDEEGRLLDGGPSVPPPVLRQGPAPSLPSFSLLLLALRFGLISTPPHRSYLLFKPSAAPRPSPPDAGLLLSQPVTAVWIESVEVSERTRGRHAAFPGVRFPFGIFPT